MGRDRTPGITGIEAHKLQSHRVLGNSRHDSQIALTLLDGEHIANWLNDASGRKRNQSRFHGGNERSPLQMLLDLRLAKKHHHCAASQPPHIKSWMTMPPR